MTIDFSMKVFSVVMEVITMYWFCGLNLERKKYHKIRIVLILLAIGAGALLLNMTMPTKHLLLFSNIFVLLAIPVVLFSGSIFLKLFVLAIFMAFGVGIEVAVKSFSVFWQGNLAAFNEQIKIDNVRGTLIAKLLTVVIIKFISLKKLNKNDISMKTAFMLLTFPFATILSFNRLMMASYLIDHPKEYMEAFITSCILIVANIVIFYLFEMQIDNEAAKRKLIVFQNAQKSQEEYYAKIIEEKKQTNFLRHELKHILLALKGYIQEEKTDEAIAYIEQITKDFTKTEISITENLAVDIILNEKSKRQLQWGLKWLLRL